ncbi:MAG: hypothetical protein QME64_08490, partial [bacterium]|nr:hypothetical protein [bacterium]
MRKNNNKKHKSEIQNGIASQKPLAMTTGINPKSEITLGFTLIESGRLSGQHPYRIIYAGILFKFGFIPRP